MPWLAAQAQPVLYIHEPLLRQKGKKLGLVRKSRLHVGLDAVWIQGF